MDGKARLVTLVPTLSLIAYSSGDQIGGVLTVTNALDTTSDTGAVLSIQVVDNAKQKSAFDVLFFNSLVTVTSVDNAACDISAAEMQKFIGRVSIAATDYSDLANVSDATKLGIGLLTQGLLTQNLYCVLQCRGTPTYVAATDLTVKIGILQD